MNVNRGESLVSRNPRGTYMVISGHLKDRINSGDILEALPSEAQLQQVYGVSRNTVRRALKLLAAEGVIESAPGSGWRLVQASDRRSLDERMVELIIEDALGVGDSYPSEAKLCERFGASRTAVRRVLAQMEGSGLLDTVAGKGRTVRALPASSGQP